MNREAEIGRRIKQRREELGLTQAELGEAVSLNKSTIQRYESGKIGKIKRPVMAAIAARLGVSPAWLELDDCSAPPDVEGLCARFDNISPVRLKRFPVLGEIACGEPIWADEDKQSYIMSCMDVDADFCLRAKGDSMTNAQINDGDIVFIKRCDIVENGDIAAVIIGDEATLKRWYYDRDNNKLVLMAENPKYPPLVYMNEELERVRCLGKAVYYMGTL